LDKRRDILHPAYRSLFTDHFSLLIPPAPIDHIQQIVAHSLIRMCGNQFFSSLSCFSKPIPFDVEDGKHEF
jgi:hypothetical protein